MTSVVKSIICLLSVSAILMMNVVPVIADPTADLTCRIEVNEVYTGIANKVIVVVPDPGEDVSDFQVKLEAGDGGDYIEIATNTVSDAFDWGWGDAIITFSWTPAADGDYTLRATVDSNNDVTETNEDNNQTSRVISAGPVTEKTVSVRIEGQTDTIWSGEVTFSSSTITDKYDDIFTLDYPTAIGAIHAASVVAPFDLVIDSMFSPIDYVESVSGEAAAGWNGWMYRVNWSSPNFGANEYALSDGDMVLWSYTAWGSQPLRTTVSSNNILYGNTLTISVDAYNGSGWSAVGAGMTVYVNASTCATDADGEVKDLALGTGSYVVYADAGDFTQYIRSNKENVLVYSASLLAETTIGQYVDYPTAGAVGLAISLNRVYNLDTGLEVTPTDGIGAYDITLTYNGVNGINILDVEGMAPFSDMTLNIDDAAGTAEFGASLTAPGPNPPVALARFVPRLVGSANSTYTITLSFTALSDGAGGDIEQELPVPSISLRRGDAQSNGYVNITDAMFIAQYVVGLRGLEEGFNIINGASVKHDGTEYDRIDITDAMFIAQYKVGIRNEYFERVP